MGKDSGFADWIADRVPGGKGDGDHRTDLLIDRLVKHLDDIEDSPRSPGFHVSSLYDFCPRQKVLADRSPEDIKLWDPDATLRVTLSVGTAIHSWLQDGVLGPAGLLLGKWKHLKNGQTIVGEQPSQSWGYVEPSMRVPVEGVPDAPEWHIVGSCDGILSTGRAIEAKSCGPTAWPQLLEAYNRLRYVENWRTACGQDQINGKRSHLADKYARSHAFQLKIYLEGLDPEKDTDGRVKSLSGGIVFYVDKTTRKHKQTGAPFQEFSIRKDPACLEAAKDKVRAVYRAEQENTLPFGVCSSRTCYKAKDCPVANECFSTEGGP